MSKLQGVCSRARAPSPAAEVGRGRKKEEEGGRKKEEEGGRKKEEEALARAVRLHGATIRMGAASPPTTTATTRGSNRHKSRRFRCLQES